MTKEQAITMLKAKRECIELDIKGNAELCDRNCGECKLNYEQGNMGEQKQALDMAIKALEQQPTHGTCKDCTNYVVGALDEEICIRGHELIHKDFYCADFETRGSENE